VKRLNLAQEAVSGAHEYMASGAMLKPREQAKLGNGIGRSYDKAQASYDRCVEQPENSSQRQ
jgi:hypothetical protein